MHEYSMTWTQFREMTLREIWLSLKRIDVRRHNNFAQQASLYGVKIPLKKTIKNEDLKGFSKEDELKAEMAMKHMISQKSQEQR